ncbi:putative transcriptional regulator [Phycicoccus elongatus Lp2]|uniref:Putative transcriptional regulator n=1 Tax=Phycicoccus elongatus Lp2 TaxID=1193181 RepID=N0DZT3_9MICO|nr:LCP family protein [Phycicoccus elongatus]CCH68961.1 putative transcriptional regulator [Phycicoccus elongatus Lp2]
MSDLMHELAADADAETPPARASRRRSERSRGRRWGLRILAVFLGLVFLVVALLGGFALFLNHKVDSNVKREALLPSQAGAASPSTPEELSAQALIAQSKGTNVLLVGSDARPGDTFSRSDVMVLVHIPEDKSKVYLIHFPRDLWVSIPGHGQAKLNASYAFGGAPLLVQSMQNLIGVRIDHVVKTDFNGFEAMTDAVGGVTVYAEEASGATGNGGVDIKQGWNTLNGKQALVFVRERYQLSEGDISRGKRQMAFVKALLMKTISPEVITNPGKIAQFTDAATKNLIVDETMTTDYMRSEAFALRNVRGGDVVFITAPFTGFGWSSDGQSIDVVDQPGMQALGDAIRQDRLGDYNRTSVIP